MVYKSTTCMIYFVLEENFILGDIRGLVVPTLAKGLQSIAVLYNFGVLHFYVFLSCHV